jgi:hypothetical protein
MSRKSSFSVPGIVSLFQVAPPSILRMMVPPAPLAQMMRSLTALTPRSRAVTPVSRGCHRSDDVACVIRARQTTNVVASLSIDVR